MTQLRVTIIGLGLIGTSMGLALKAKNENIRITGHDAEHSQSGLARKKGAVDKTSLSLPGSCDDADVVIIATPLTAVRDTLEVIGPHLKPGCIVTDTATLKEPVLAWAGEFLPEGVSFVGGDPILNPAAQPVELATLPGLEAAHAGLFQEALYALCPSADVSSTAVERVSNLVNMLGARPFYVDPVEHDGLRAAVEGLPALTSLALMQRAANSPGWREARQFADHMFAMATAPLFGDVESQRAHALLNANYLLPHLDGLIQELTQLRQWIADENKEALENAFEEGIDARARWLGKFILAERDREGAQPEMPGALSSLGNLFGFGMFRRKDKDQDEE